MRFASAWQIQRWILILIYRMDHRAPNIGARESIQELKGSAMIKKEQQYELTSTLRTHVSSCICSRRWPSWPSLRREAPWHCKLYIPQYRGMPGPRSGSGWVGEQGRGYWLVQIVVLPIGLQTPSAPWVLSLAAPLGAMCSIQ